MHCICAALQRDQPHAFTLQFFDGFSAWRACHGSQRCGIAPTDLLFRHCTSTCTRFCARDCPRSVHSATICVRASARRRKLLAQAGKSPVSAVLADGVVTRCIASTCLSLLCGISFASRRIASHHSSILLSTHFLISRNLRPFLVKKHEHLLTEAPCAISFSLLHLFSPRSQMASL